MSDLDTVTLADLAAPLGALRLLTADFPSLPAGWVRISDTYPDRLELSFHDDLGAFEVWRAALGIAPDSVTYTEQADSRTRVLKAWCEFAGARVCLTGFAAVPDPTGGAA